MRRTKKQKYHDSCNENRFGHVAVLGDEHQSRMDMEARGLRLTSPRRMTFRQAKENALIAAMEKTRGSIDRVDELLGQTPEGGQP